MNNPSRSDEDHITTWQGYDVTRFADYLKASPFHKYVGDKWLAETPCAILLDTRVDIDVFDDPRSVQCVLDSFPTTVAVKDTHATSYVIVAPRLVCDMLVADCSWDSTEIAGISAIPAQWQATAQQASSWLSAATTVARTVGVRFAIIQDSMAIIDKIRGHAASEGIKPAMLCDAFAIVVEQTASGSPEMGAVDELITVAQAVVN